MVLQNKHKARASRRYNAARGGISDARGRGGSSSRGRGSYRGGSNNQAFPSLNPDEDEDDGEEHDDEEGDESFDEDKGKYSRRKLESNAWRYHEEEIDPHAEEEAEPEPEIDLRGLLERVAKLDSSRTTKALSSEKAAESSLQADLQDIDQSLIYLLDRQREREKSSSKHKTDAIIGPTKARGGLSSSEIKLLEMEGKKLLEERETQRRHYGRAQMLKAQNEQQSRVKSINIGDRRRAPEEKDQSSKSKTTTREKVNLAALYDYADDGKMGASSDGGLDAFLQELDVGKEASKVSLPSTGDIRGASRQNGGAPIPTTAAISTPSQRKEHEDFLDGII